MGLTFEAVYDNGVIQLPANVILPAQTKTYVVVPKASPETKRRVNSPRLVHSQQAADFVMEVLEEGFGAPRQ